MSNTRASAADARKADVDSRLYSIDGHIDFFISAPAVHIIAYGMNVEEGGNGRWFYFYGKNGGNLGIYLWNRKPTHNKSHKLPKQKSEERVVPVQ